MKRIVEIKPIGEFSNIQVNCLYEFENEIYILTDKDKMERFPRGTKSVDLPPEFTASFDKTRIPVLRYEYEDGEEATTLDIQIKEVVMVFWGLNPTCLVNGIKHSNTKAQVLNVEDVILRNVASYESWRLQVEVARTIDEFTPEKLLNVAYYYGLRPINGMKRGELILSLASFPDGILHKQIEMGRSKFLEIWSLGKDADRDMIVYLRKAIQYGIIVNKFNAGRDNFFLGQTRLGVNIEDIVTYFRSEEKLYEDHIVREVDGTESIDVKRFKEETKEVDQHQKKAVDGGIDGVELEQLTYKSATKLLIFSYSQRD